MRRRRPPRQAGTTASWRRRCRSEPLVARPRFNPFIGCDGEGGDSDDDAIEDGDGDGDDDDNDDAADGY